MIIFHAGLPRAGSTLLISLLNQRPDVYASPSSNLCDTLCATYEAWHSSPETTASGSTHEDLYRVLKSIITSRYDTKRVVFDKSRDWPDPLAMETMKHVQGDVKIVACVRPIADCLASFAKIAKVKPNDIQDFCRNSALAKHLFDSYNRLKAGYKTAPENFLIIEYDDLVKDTQGQLDRIAKFVNLKPFKHSTENVADSKEKDEVWGIKDLHKVRKKVRKRKYSARKILGDDLYNCYQGGEFWNDKPEPSRKHDLLDMELEAAINGEFKKAQQMIEQLLIERPNCNRVKYNAGFHKLYQGDLQQGHKYLDYGRLENVFGSKCLSNRPIWNGERGTVLLHMEGGLGDQIKSYTFASDIQKRGNRVVIACSAVLAEMFAEKFITVQHEAIGGVFHDYYIPSMSVVIPLNHTYDSLSGKPYISSTAKMIPGRIGVRWSGNPQFEHEQHRKFPPKLLFDAVRNFDCVSLQRDEGIQLKPAWMAQADVSDWKATRKSISQCELVITSCTSVAHLAAAMGVKTWIIIPILSYYIWALPGNKSPYYDSVTLFRQEKYGDWSDPFKNIKEQLKCMHTLKIAA